MHKNYSKKIKNKYKPGKIITCATLNNEKATNSP